jgi:hypothetical protein
MIKADIESVIREREVLISTLLEKCRYAAFLLHNPNVARPLLQLKILRNLQEKGFKEVYILTHDDLPLSGWRIAHHPLPERVWEVFSCTGSFADTVVRKDNLYYVFVTANNDIAVEVEADYTEPLLTNPIRREVVKGVEFEVFPREEMEELEMYFSKRSKKYGVYYAPYPKQLIPLDYDEYYLSRGRSELPEFLQIRHGISDLIGRTISIKSPLPINIHELVCVELMDYLDDVSGWTTSRVLRRLGTVYAIREDIPERRIVDVNEMDFDLLAAYRELERAGFEPVIVKLVDVNRIYRSKLPEPDKPWIRFDRKSPPLPHPPETEYILRPREGLREEVEPMKLVLEKDRVVLIDEKIVGQLPL